MNFKLLHLSFLALFLSFSQAATAQCEYTLKMYDSAGDGWDGGILGITSGASVTPFTLTDPPGDSATVTFTVTDGEPLTLQWSAGAFDEEISFVVYDYEGDIVFQIAEPAAGVLFTGSGSCPQCLEPRNLQNENIYDTRAKLRWTPLSLSPALGWWVIYGPKGFVPGSVVDDSVYVTSPEVLLTGLFKKTEYDWYVLEMCDSTNFPPLVGPVSFLTYWTNDVGISGVITPVSDCNLGVETVEIVMTNYGAATQSLVPFSYSVNGIDAGVPQPQDGYYTGVLGKDSSEAIIFETTYNFSEPGEYLIAVYTQMADDEDILNDTFYYYITNRAVVPYAQNFENWNGGWYVDTSSASASWEFGMPINTVISAAASGENAWVTQLDSSYNNGELSYLRSPCFDFSDLTEDPLIEFSIIYDTEEDFDGGWLETSIDEGQNWDKVGAIGEGMNWYNFVNTQTNLGDVWAGNSGGWQKARIRLLGMAGESNVQFRFAFGSDISISLEGMGVDDVRVYVPFANDLSGEQLSTEAEGSDCGAEADRVTFVFANIGNQPQSSFTVSYSVNGAPPVAETVTATLQPYESFAYTFTAPFDSRDGVFNIQCWTLLAGDQYPANDTVYYTINHLPKPVPFFENFENQTIPADWTLTGSFVEVTNANNNVSYVLETNLWTLDPDFSYELPRYGAISAGDTLSFDYRITNFDGSGTVPTVLAAGTKIDVLVSTDCDTYETVYSINSTTHTPSVGLQTVKIGLDDYAGGGVKIRFDGTWTAGDFYFDLDNINLRACAADMMLTATTTPSTNGQNGTATVFVGLGNPPYSYAWSTGDTSQTAAGLPVGPVTVTVFDALGCTDVLTVNIGAVSTQDIEGLASLDLFPNPTTGSVVLNAAFHRAVDANVQILNLLGQPLWEANASDATALSEQIDLGNFPDGLYLVRLRVDGRVLTKKLVKSR